MTRRSSSRSFSTILVAGLLVVGAGAACEGCDEPLHGPGVGGGLPIGDPGKQGRVLTYVGEEPLELFLGQTAQLRFTRKNADGSPVDGDAITIEVHGSAVTAPGDAFTTDVGGGIEVPIAAGVEEGDATVVARATDLDGSIDEAVAHVHVLQNPSATLKVTVDADTRIPVAVGDARVLIGAAPPSCEAILDGATEPSAQITSQWLTFPSTQTFEGLPTGAKAVVVVDGRNAEGRLIAKGCGSTDELPGGLTTNVSITLTQGKSVLDGDYDVLMHMALGQALPHPYDDIVDMVTAIIADPAGYALYIALREIDRQTGFTTFVTRNGIEQTYSQIEAATFEDPNAFPTWAFAREQLDTLLVNTLGQTYVDVTNVGAGIRDVVTDFEVGARFTVDDHDDGVTLTIGEQWKDIVIYWPLGCDDGDLACARRPLTLNDLDLAPVTTGYLGTYAYEPSTGVGGVEERYAVTTDPHGLNVRYGAFLIAILEQVVFPSLPGGSANEDFGEFLQSVVGCQNIASSLTSDATAEQFITGICDGALQLAGAEIENRLEQLQIDATDPSVQGLQSAGTFALLDKDQDLTTELVDDYSYDVAWNNPDDPAATQDISAPIRGDGLRTRTLCVNDGDCTGLALGGADDKICAPRASYLKIANVELGCEAAKGGVAGGVACVGDGDCASGLCVPVGTGGSLRCYEACDAMADCHIGDVCSDSGGLLDLDTTLNGLGDVGFRGCAVP